MIPTGDTRGLRSRSPTLAADSEPHCWCSGRAQRHGAFTSERRRRAPWDTPGPGEAGRRPLWEPRVRERRRVLEGAVRSPWSLRTRGGERWGQEGPPCAPLGQRDRTLYRRRSGLSSQGSASKMIVSFRIDTERRALRSPRHDAPRRRLAIRQAARVAGAEAEPRRPPSRKPGGDGLIPGGASRSPSRTGLC